MKEEYPLKWPEGYTRTLLSDREDKNQWKKPFDFYMAQLEKELRKNDVISYALTRNMGSMSDRDPGAALYFSRKAEQDFSWQKILHIDNPNPSYEEIEAAAKILLVKNHPDRGGDVDIYKQINTARQTARRWAEGKEHTSLDYVIPCDRFKQVKWNINALNITLNSIRRIKESGSPVLLERAFKGFQQITEHAGVSHVHATTA